MGWKMRNRVPSDSALKAYDDRMSARENEIRRPGRKIDVISNEDYAKMLEARAEQRRKEEEVQLLWQSKHLDAIRQRNNLIRYKLFLLFKENFAIDTSDADTVAKQPLAQAIAAVCNSITKDSVAYTNMTSFPKDGGNVPWYAGLLRKYVQDSLGISIDRDDLLSVREAAKEKKTLLELIRSQVKRDLEEVTAGIELHQKLLSKPEFKDLKGATDLKSAILQCIKSVDDSMLQNDNQNGGTQSEKDDIEKKYVAAVHKALDEASTDHGSAGIMGGYGRRLKMDAEKLKTLKSSLNTKAGIRAFYDFCTDTEWSKSVEGLTEEKKVLESLVGPDSDAILRTIDETIAETYLENNRLVEESAKIRNLVCSSRGGRYGMAGRLGLMHAAGATERYENVCKEESVKFQDMENDKAFNKLFPGRNFPKEKLYRNRHMFMMSGFI